MCISPKVNISLKKPAKLRVSASTDPAFQSILRASNDNVERLQQQRLQAFLNKEPDYHADMEIERLGFSEHLFEFRFGLEHLAENQTLKISSKSKMVVKELAAACRAMKLPVETRQFHKRHFLYATRPVLASVHPLKPEKTETTSLQPKQAAS